MLDTARTFASAEQPPPRRRAAIICLAMAAEGCCDVFESHLSAILPLVYAACADPVQSVREAAWCAAELAASAGSSWQAGACGCRRGEGARARSRAYELSSTQALHRA